MNNEITSLKRMQTRKQLKSLLKEALIQLNNLEKSIDNIHKLMQTATIKEAA